MNLALILLSVLLAVVGSALVVAAVALARQDALRADLDALQNETVTALELEVADVRQTNSVVRTFRVVAATDLELAGGTTGFALPGDLDWAGALDAEADTVVADPVWSTTYTRAEASQPLRVLARYTFQAPAQANDTVLEVALGAQPTDYVRELGTPQTHVLSAGTGPQVVSGTLTLLERRPGDAVELSIRARLAGDAASVTLTRCTFEATELRG